MLLLLLFYVFIFYYFILIAKILTLEGRVALMRRCEIDVNTQFLNKFPITFA